MENQQQTTTAATSKVNWKKIVIIFVTGFLVLMAIVFALVFKLTGGLVATTDSLFENIQAQKYASAYDLMSTQYQKKHTIDDWRELVETLSFDSVDDTYWASRNITGDMGSLEGTVTYSDGRKIPMIINFVKEQGDWKVLDFVAYSEPKEDVVLDSRRTASDRVDSGSGALKSDEDLIKETLQQFYLGVEADDYATFYNDYTASSFQKESSLADFNEAFDVYLGNEEWLDPINDGDLAFSSAVEDGILSLVGTFENDTRIVDFDTQFVQEDDVWMVIRIYVGSERK